MTDAFHDYHDRRSVPWPALSRPDRINAATIDTTIASQIYQRLVSVIPYADITMAPYPSTSAAFLQAVLRPRKLIAPAPFKYLLDTDHQEKRQYPVPSRSGGGYRPAKTRLPLPGPFFLNLIRDSLIALRRFNLICCLSRPAYCD
jgi:hypothetical protein